MELPAYLKLKQDIEFIADELEWFTWISDQDEGVAVLEKIDQKLNGMVQTPYIKAIWNELDVFHSIYGIETFNRHSHKVINHIYDAATDALNLLVQVKQDEDQEFKTKFPQYGLLLNSYFNHLRMLEALIKRQIAIIAKSSFDKGYTIIKDSIEANKPAGDSSQNDTRADGQNGRVVNKEYKGIKNNFDFIPMQNVYNFFYTNLVKKNYLDEADLIPYLKQAFELKTPPSNKFSFKNNPKKLRMQRVFYDYYHLAGRVQGRKTEYAALLGNYFEGYVTSNVSNNFSR